MVNEEIDACTIYKWIEDIPDPEIPVVNIKELGMLRKVKYENGNCIVTVTPTYTACPAMGYIETQIKERLALHGIDNVQVNLTYQPAWSTDWLSEETKSKLRKYGISPPQHSSCSKVFTTSLQVACPRCNSKSTKVISKFGSTACKALYKCNNCKEPFEYFKCH